MPVMICPRPVFRSLKFLGPECDVEATARKFECSTEWWKLLIGVYRDQGVVFRIGLPGRDHTRRSLQIWHNVTSTKMNLHAKIPDLTKSVRLLFAIPQYFMESTGFGGVHEVPNRTHPKNRHHAGWLQSTMSYQNPQHFSSVAGPSDNNKSFIALLHVKRYRPQSSDTEDGSWEDGLDGA